jgi:hypothetical protein
MSIFEFAAILGALAWIPPLFKIIKNYLTTPEIRIITQKNAEIGFTTYGPIFNIRIAFATRHKDVVLSAIKITLRHESGEERVFSWQGIVQRMGEIRNPEGATIPWEKEHSVLAIKLNEKEVEERLIRFQEEDFHINKEIYEAKSAKKLSYLFEKGGFNPDEFLQSEEMSEQVSFIKHWTNWKQGEYSITFDIESPEKFILTDNKYKFSFTPLDIEVLEKNKDLILLSYEDEIKNKQKDYQLNNVIWGWRNPVINKAT